MGLYADLPNAGKPALLSIVPEFCNKYVTAHESDELPSPLSELYQACLLH